MWGPVLIIFVAIIIIIIIIIFIVIIIFIAVIIRWIIKLQILEILAINPNYQYW